jgi:CubicO group peptidase (beta-lactamase class C family)
MKTVGYQPMKYATFVFVVFSCCGVLLSTSPATADDFDRARAEIRDVMAIHNIPSVVVAVAHNGKIIWEEGFGWADVAKRIPATTHTPYSLASISKPVTATALMIFAERGAIDLDKPMNDYLGHQKLVARIGNVSDATVRRPTTLQDFRCTLTSSTRTSPCHVPQWTRQFAATAYW